MKHASFNTGDHTEMFIPYNLYQKSLKACNVKRENNLEPKKFKIYKYISLPNRNVTLQNVHTAVFSTNLYRRISKYYGLLFIGAT